MFRRTTRLEVDMVAAAQRRLAALAAHHTGDRGDLDAAGQPPSEPALPAADPTTTASAAAPSTAPPRHIGTRRLEASPWGVSAPHLTVAALAVLALVVAVAWWSLRSVPRSESVQLSSHGVPPATSSSPAASPVVEPPSQPSTGGPAAQVSTAAARLVIDVAGKVRQPGIVELPAGSRVVDAIAAAGGARPGVELTSLNLARMLVDGEQIVVGIDIPVVGPAPGAPVGSLGTTGSSVAPVNLNTATAEQLDTLPGVGPVTAQAILAWRTDNGSFASVDELLEVSGIGDATLADLRPYVYV